MIKKVLNSMNIIPKPIFFFLVIYFFINPLILNGETYWNPANGPFLGDIRVVKVGNDNTVYTGTANAGLYISRNAGNSWEQVYETLIGQKLINSIAILDNIILVSTGTSGIFRSTNNGNTWNYHPSFDVNISFYVFAKDKQNNVYAGTSNGVYLSTDKGINWVQKSNGLPIAPVFSLYKSSNGILYAGVFPLKGIYKSTDNGENWFQSSEGIPNSNIYEFAEHPDGSMFVATSNGIFKSTNQGASWNKIITGFYGSVIFTIVVENNGRIYAGTSDDGIYISNDVGQTWSRGQVGEVSDKISIYSIAIAPSGVVYAGTSEGIYKTLNKGLSWELSNRMLNAFNVRSIFSKRNAEVLVGTDNYGVFKTTDNGITWKKVNAGLATRYVYSFTMDGANNIIIGTGAGVYRSSDDGESWFPINDGLKAGSVYSLIRAANGDLFAAVWSWGIYKSTNNGASWFATNSGIPDAAISMNCIFQASDGTIYAGSNNGGLFISTNYGNSWRSVQAVESNAITKIFETKLGTILVATKTDGLWRTTDGGNSWKNIKTEFGDNPPLIKTIITGVDDELLAGTHGKGIFRSIDDGLAWDEYNDGLMNLNVDALLLTENNSIFIGTIGSGLWGHIIPVSVENKADFPFDITINPMPVYNDAYIVFKSINEGNLMISIYDVSGRNYGTLHNGYTRYGENIIKISLSDLPKGVYFLNFNFLGYNFIQKIIKLD